ncbi:hypothetical protein [Streptomyces milbemycinicus]|uniref:hypothetical protein n=1 Tax=Streptomyces milbemycinicus TaxID=476552 RepID=UPI0033F164FA
MPDGQILYNANGNGSVWVNEPGKSDGTWKEYQMPIAAGYSRALQYVEGTGRVVILQADFGGGGADSVRYAGVDLGRSKGAYITLVNRATGRALSPDARGRRTRTSPRTSPTSSCEPGMPQTPRSAGI